MKKIDVHIHANTMAEEFSPESYGESIQKTLDYLKDRGIEKAILMSMGETGNFTNEDCISLCKAHPMISWNCNFDDQNPETIEERMAHYKEQGAVGVGELCINKRLDSEICKAIFAAAEKMEMPTLIHMSPKEGFQYGVVDEPGLALLEKILQEFPHLPVVGHSQVFWIEISGDAPASDQERYGRGEGKVVPGGRLVELFEKYPNLYGDLSAGSGYCAVTRDEEFGLGFIGKFADRLLFGTDLVDPESQWNSPLWKWLEEKGEEGKISRETLNKIFYRNAEKLYGIELNAETIVELETPCGRIRGRVEADANVFWGIRYGRAERFSYPEQITKWEGTYDATHKGACAVQMREFHSEALSQNPFFYHEFRENIRFHYSDDCLYLNIWTPLEQGDKRPVIVFIHGGAFLGGSSYEKHLMDPKWTEAGVLAVTLNYRLGPFGFLCTTDGELQAGHSGNYGLYDQVAALRWIHDNIESFGGDPDNITLMGQSAGGMCVLRHCTSPLTKGLFQKAVILSGGGKSDSFMHETPLEEMKRFGDQVMKASGCDSLKAFRKLGAQKILAAFYRCLSQSPYGLGVSGPVADGELFPHGIKESIDKHENHDIPYVLCCTGNDLWMPEIKDSIQEWAENEADRGNMSVYAAFFERELPGDEEGAFHTADLWYWMGTLGSSWRPMTEWDFELSRRMRGYLENFAKTSSPGLVGEVSWNAYSEKKQCMFFGENSTHMERLNM